MEATELRARHRPDHHRADWVTVALPDRTAPTRPISWRPLVVQMVVAVVAVFTLVAIAGTIAARQIAERESVNDALRVTDLLAVSVLQPALTDALVARPTPPVASLSTLDDVVRTRILNDSIIRVKLWDASGRILYSDEPALIGETFALGEQERDVLRHPVTIGEISDLSRPENRFERSSGKLLEVYRPVWTPSGQPLLFETYSRYDVVTSRSSQVWRGFAGVTVSSLVLMLVLQAPLSWALIGRLRRAQLQRERLLSQAAAASAQERRRIAATLHDGVVQELVATSFVVAGAAEQAHAGGDRPLAKRLETAVGTVRASIAGLRTLLVDIYPPSLRAAGIAAALPDLAATLRARGIEVNIDIDDDLDLDQNTQALVFGVTQECLRNAERHAAAGIVSIRLSVAAGAVCLQIDDDGVGFDPATVLDAPAEGHFGVRVMRDLAAAAGARLSVASRPGAGTSWRLEVPGDDR